jgi:hypothetical protein
MGRGQQWEMLAAANNLKAPDRVRAIIKQSMTHKAAVDALSLTSPGDDIAPYQAVANGFVSSLAPWSAFDAILAGTNTFRRLPSRTRIVVNTMTATGNLVSEGAPKPLTTMNFVGESPRRLTRITERQFVCVLASSE